MHYLLRGLKLADAGDDRYEQIRQQVDTENPMPKMGKQDSSSFDYFMQNYYKPALPRNWLPKLFSEGSRPREFFEKYPDLANHAVALAPTAVAAPFIITGLIQGLMRMRDEKKKKKQQIS